MSYTAIFSSFPKLHETGCDVIDDGNQIRMKMNMPGLKKNEINLNVTDNSIEVTGEHKEEEKKKNYLRKERHSMSYYQTIPLSEKVVPGKVKAKLTDGVRCDSSKEQTYTYTKEKGCQSAVIFFFLF